MDCGINFVKYLLFIFNFIFTLCGLALLIVGVLLHLSLKEVKEVVDESITFSTIGLIVVGAIIFTIAFFGCCGAIRESHCMIVMFALFLLTIFVVQLAIGIFAFVKLRGHEHETIKEKYTVVFNDYWTVASRHGLVDFCQSNLHCCGVDSAQDFNRLNGTVPWSCCHEASNDKSPCNGSSGIYDNGCVDAIINFLKDSGKVLGGVAIGIAAVELFGIVFALCLANAIRNAERRGYRV